MNIILGFGQHHIDKTKAFCRRIAEAVGNDPENAESVAQAVACEEGTFKDKGWRIATLRRAQYAPRYEGSFAVVVEGVYYHIRDDHPLSPDGYASLECPWCVTVIHDEGIWGRRDYITLLQS